MKRPSEAAENVESIESVKKTKANSLLDGETLTPEKSLSLKVREKKQLVRKKAKLIITLDKTINGEGRIDEPAAVWSRPQFFVQDLQRVILYSLMGTHYRFFPRWCKILRPNHLKSVNLITINNVSEHDFKNSSKKFKKFTKPFLQSKESDDLNSIEFMSPYANNRDFHDEFVPVPIVREQWMKLRDEPEYKEKLKQVVKKYKKAFSSLKSKSTNSKNVVNDVSSSAELDKISRTSLLLNPVQLIRENYPLPFDTTSEDRFADYVHSKDEYEPVSDRSPLYALDCEMCFNEDGEAELVWFAMVDEGLQVVYETFVKPRKTIRRYLTAITGITAKTLENVKTDLSDVQAKIREILPKDAILCGQSLNNDFHALKMFHPYVIDTSIIYNSSGNRDIKSSLKNLSAQYLGKLIQESTHNPSVDARASMQLVLLKLRRGLDFGDVIINGCTSMFNEEDQADLAGFDQVDLNSEESIRKFIYQTGLNIEQDFFDVLGRSSISSVYIDRKRRELHKSVEFHLAESNSSAIEKLNESLNKSKFTWTQLYVDSNDQEINKSELKEVLNSLRDLYDRLEDDCMLMVALTGRTNESTCPERSYSNELRRGRCFLKIKNERVEQLDAEIGELFKIVRPSSTNNQHQEKEGDEEESENGET